MSKKYKNPPLVEAVCQFNIPDNVKWDAAIPGQIYDKVSKSFPEKKQIPIQELLGREDGVVIATREFMRFKSANEQHLIQVGPRFLSVHWMKPYHLWKDFKPLIEDSFKTLADVSGTEIFQRIGLMYINRIEIDETITNLNDYFEITPHLGEKLPQSTRAFLVGCVFDFDEGKDTCRIQLANAVPEKEEGRAFMLELDYYSERQFSSKEVMQWVEKAHTNVENIFEGCITQKLRDIFGEKDK